MIACVAVGALWVNEMRFDYAKAASKTRQVADIATARPAETVSFTGPMDTNLAIEGDHVEAFVGYLVVERHAEIYCWDEDDSGDGPTEWRLRWQVSVERNGRNSGITQELSSVTLRPVVYRIGEFEIDPHLTEFVDDCVAVDANVLDGIASGFKPQGRYLHYPKGKSDGLGDERISYKAIQLPATATWFGQLDGGGGSRMSRNSAAAGWRT